MTFFTIKISKRTVGFAVFIILIATWIFFRPSYRPIQVFGGNKPIYQGSKDRKLMAFTYNVAWGNEYIPPLLEIFKNKNIKATFFVEGRWAEKYPELLKLIYECGHEIGNHGYSHAHHAELSYEQNLNEIKKAEQVIENIIGIKTTLFAPPYGEFSDLTVKAASSMNYRLIMWTIDTIDWKKPGVDFIVNKVLENSGNGKIVLMHPTDDTVKAMPTIIDNLHREGFKITTVGQLLTAE